MFCPCFVFVFEVVGLQPGEYVIQKPGSAQTTIILNFKRPLNLEEDDNLYDDYDDDEDVYLPFSMSLEGDGAPYDDDEDGESVAALPSVKVKARYTNSA